MIQLAVDFFILIFKKTNHGKTILLNEIHDMYVAFQKRGYIAALQIKKFQKTFFDFIKIDFNQHSRSSRFLSKIFVKKLQVAQLPL